MKIDSKRLLGYAAALIVAGAAILGVGHAVTQNDKGDLAMETKTYALSEISAISINTDSPAVIIKPVTGDQVTLSWQADEYVKFEAGLDGGELAIDYRISANWLEALLMSPVLRGDYVLEIELPESYAGTLDVHTASGSVSVYGALHLEDIHLTSVSGAVDVSDIDSKSGVEIRSTSGKVHADAVHTAEDIQLQTVSGTADLRKAAASGGVSVHTTSGGITVADASAGGDVTVKTTSGKTDLSQVHSGAAITFSSVSGSANLTGLECASFSSKTVSGSVRFESLTADTADMQSTSGSIRGALNGAQDDYAITVKTVSGSSNLQSAAAAGKQKSLAVKTVSGGIDVRFTGADGE